MINGLNLTGCKLLNETFSMHCNFFIVCHPTDVCVTNFSIEQNTKTTSLSYYSPNGEVRTRQTDERVIDYSLSVLLHIFHLTLLVDKTFFWGELLYIKITSDVSDNILFRHIFIMRPVTTDKWTKK